ILLTGLGQFVAGRRKRGIIWLAVSAGFAAASLLVVSEPALIPALLLLIAVGAIISLAAMIDAYVCGRRSPNRMLNRPVVRYLIGLGLVGSSFFLNPSLRLSHLLKRYVVEAFVMPTRSMSPTIQ